MAYFFSHGYGVSSEIGHIFWSGVMALKITKSLIRKKKKRNNKPLAWHDAIKTISKIFYILLQALCGVRVDVPLLGGEKIGINLQDEVIKPSTVKRVIGKGLPNPKDSARRGDLIVSFDIVFPERLSTTTRDLFRSHLPGKWGLN